MLIRQKIKGTANQMYSCLINFIHSKCFMDYIGKDIGQLPFIIRSKYIFMSS